MACCKTERLESIRTCIYPLLPLAIVVVVVVVDGVDVWFESTVLEHDADILDHLSLKDAEEQGAEAVL